jgi:hypothetical protein
MGGLGLAMRGDAAMEKANKSAKLASRFRMTLYGIMLSSLLLAAACAEGGYNYQPSSYPSQSYPGYYSYPSFYYSPTYPYEDPLFWQRWQDYQGRP